MNTKLYKNSAKKIISGVCYGIAEAINIDPSIVRIVTAALCIYWPVLVLVYLVLALILPDKSVVVNTPQQSASDSRSETFQQKAEQQSTTATSFSRSGSTGVVFSILLICSGIGLFITRVVFDYAIGLSDFITFATLGLGIYLIISGIVESDDPKLQRKTKIIVGSLIILFCVLWIFNLFGLNIFSVINLFSSIGYLWPLFIIAIGINVLLPTRKASAIIWLTLIVIIFFYTIFHGSTLFNPFSLVHL